ncbi:MAG: hypothetical protein KGJ68_13500 [Gammaproteobacteria bacterium]|nr:hypothetical protein [Gammaproteobacteria bacterium]
MTLVPARRMRRLLASYALALSIPALLTSCGGYGNVYYGTAVITMSDVSGGFSGFSGYVVNIGPITLTRNDGLLAEPLAQEESVDLVRLHDVGELVEAPAVPVGTYTSMSLTFDYTSPFILLDVNGVPTAAGAVDPAGFAMSTVTVTVNFDPNNLLVINGGTTVRLAIDLNLAASNTINLGVSPPTVTVQPFVSATVLPADGTVMRAGGNFVVSQPSSSSYVINVRPFADLFSALGALTVNTTSTTYFNINGTVYTGAAGLAAMAQLQASAPVSAYGTLGDFSTITPTFNATAVYAGTAIQSPLADYLTGTVAAVSGNTLTLKGDDYVTRIGTAVYLSSVPVTVGSATAVTEDGVVTSGLTTQAISVGQAIKVAGQGAPDTNGNLTLDATQGAIRLQPTPVWGTLNSAAPGSMSLNMLSLGGFEPAAFNFAGTGSSAANNAVPGGYLLDTGALDESATAAGTLVKAVGLVTPLGSAPPDFSTASVTLGSATPQTLVVEWGKGGTASPFSSASSAGLVVNLANANLEAANHYIATGPQQVDLTSLPASPTIAFAAGVPISLSVGNDVTISSFNTAAGFATALGTTLNGTNLVYRLVCVGQYSSATNTFTATSVAVNLQTTT